MVITWCLVFFIDDAKSPLILDNLSFRVLPLDKRVDLLADMFINETGVFKLQDNKLIKIGRYSNKFQDLLQKIQKEKQ